MRIQLELPEGRVRELEALMETAGIATKKELFNTALTLFEWAIQEKSSGRIIASMDEEQQRYKELIMPALSAAGVRRTGNEPSFPRGPSSVDSEIQRNRLEEIAEEARSIADKLAEEGRRMADASRQEPESAGRR